MTIVRMRLVESPVNLIEILDNKEDFDEQIVSDYVEGRKVRISFSNWC